MDNAAGGLAFGLATRIFDGSRARLCNAAFGTLPTRPPTGALEVRAVRFSRVGWWVGWWVGLWFSDQWLGERFADLVDPWLDPSFGSGIGEVRRRRPGGCGARLGHCGAPGSPGASRPARARSAVTISGPNMVTSPAPMVMIKSPGAAAFATSRATTEKSGT